MFPFGDKELKLGMIGFTEGNAHPFSWSAMINGKYDADLMREYCKTLYPTIPQYLSKQPPHTLGIPGAKVTHICFTGFVGREDADLCARINGIPHVVDTPEEMIGQVDAVIIATDNGNEHVERCRPFVEAGIPMFVDKPLVNKEEDLRTFVEWRKNGAKFISSSSLRYCKEIEPYYENHYELGEIRYICSPMAKKYETYGIHALERMYPLLGEGFLSVRNTGTCEQALVTIKHKNGCNVTVVQGYDLATCGMMVLGSCGAKLLASGDSYYCFKRQMDLFVHWLRTGEEPFPFSETVELMKLVIAGIRSREEGGREVFLSEIEV